MRLLALLLLALMGQAPPSNPPASQQSGAAGDLEKSAYFAFVDHDYIFTVEVTGPGILLLNFVSMTDNSRDISAKQVRVRLEDRTIIPTLFHIDTGDPKEPITVASLTMKPRSSFGVRVLGNFGDARELSGVTIHAGEEDFKLAPLTSLAFENLVLKVNQINLDSPNFRDDWQVLHLDAKGTRAPAARRF